MRYAILLCLAGRASPLAALRLVELELLQRRVHRAERHRGRQRSGAQVRKCMRAHGVPNFPDPTSNGSGGIQIHARPVGLGADDEGQRSPGQRAGVQVRDEACRSDLPNGGIRRRP